MDSNQRGVESAREKLCAAAKNLDFPRLHAGGLRRSGPVDLVTDRRAVHVSTRTRATPISELTQNARRPRMILRYRPPKDDSPPTHPTSSRCPLDTRAHTRQTPGDFETQSQSKESHPSAM